MVDAESGSLHPARPAAPAQSYRLRLLFGLPPQGAPCEFDVLVQGMPVRRNLRLSHDSSGVTRAIETIDEVQISDELEIQLVPKDGRPRLSGLELIRQHSEASQ